MFPLSLVRSLVLSAINSNTNSAYYVYKTASAHIMLTVSIKFGTVYYGVVAIKDDTKTYLDILNASLDDVLSYGQYKNTVYSDIELLFMYSRYYSLNKKQLAANLGISRPTLNKYLSGSVPLPLIYKKFIALDFNLPSHLLDFDFLHSDNYCPLTKQQLDTLPF